MGHSDRPTQIAAILDTIYSKYPADIGASLEAYITDLEANALHRPAQIAAILNSIVSDNLGGKGVYLEAYVSDLESRQSVAASYNGTAPKDPTTLYWHSVKRENHRRERASRNQMTINK